MSIKADAKQDAAKDDFDELLRLTYQSIGKLDSLLVQINQFYDESGTGSNLKPLAERLRLADQDRRYTEREILDGIRAIQNTLKVIMDATKETRARNARLQEENQQLRLQIEVLTSAQNESREWRKYIERKLDRLLDATGDIVSLVDGIRSSEYDFDMRNR